VFREQLEKRNIRLAPKKITAPNYEYEFRAAWKNDIWHVYERCRLILSNQTLFWKKANRWVGRSASLAESPEPFGCTF